MHWGHHGDRSQYVVCIWQTVSGGTSQTRRKRNLLLLFCWSLGTSKVKENEQGSRRLCKTCLPGPRWREGVGTGWGQAVPEQQRVSAEGVERPMGALTFWQNVLPYPETSPLGVTVSGLKDSEFIREKEASPCVFSTQEEHQKRPVHGSTSLMKGTPSLHESLLHVTRPGLTASHRIRRH